MTFKLSAMLWPLSIPVVCSCLYIAGLSGSYELTYRSSIVLSDQWWALITAPLLHTNNYHLVMNLAAYLIICQLSDSSLKAWRMPLITCVLGVFSTLGFALFNETLTSLVGLSGALHGVVAYLVIKEYRDAPIYMTVLGAGLMIKVVWEQFAGGSTVTAELIGANVATLSHLTGAISGAIMAIAIESRTSFMPKTH